MENTKGQTSSGFKYNIASENLEDMEILELFAQLEDNGLLLPKILDNLLGEEQKKKLYDHVRTKNGKVPISEVSKELEEIFSHNAVKN